MFVYVALCIAIVLKPSLCSPILPKDLHEISKKFEALLKATGCSPWRFSAMVAHSFASAVIPPGLYNTLKLCLLLSLVQTRVDATDTFYSLDLLVLTTDTLVLDR